MGGGGTARDVPAQVLPWEVSSERRHLEVREISPETRQTPFAKHRTNTRKIPARDA